MMFCEVSVWGVIGDDKRTHKLKGNVCTCMLSTHVELLQDSYNDQFQAATPDSVFSIEEGTVPNYKPSHVVSFNIPEAA